MENLEIYNKVREVPETAKKPITGGRLKGMTDINPMWRIKVLTEHFGVCGIGWYYEVVDKRIDTVEGAKEMIATIQINLYVKIDGEWSKPIMGIGGSMVASMERNGLYVDDEVWKKAQTDALSVACKNLGIGADVYWNSDNDKYVDQGRDNFNASNSKASTYQRKPSAAKNRPSMLDEPIDPKAKEIQAKISEYASAHGMTTEEICNDYKVGLHTPAERLEEVYKDLTSASTSDSNGEQMPDFAAIDEPLPFGND